MSIISSLPYSLTNGTTADATQVMANFNQIYNNVNANASSSGVNSSITQLTGLTTPLSVAQGGTGANTAGAALTSLGALAAANNLSDVSNISTARTNLGLGSMATQGANAVAITGGSISGTSITGSASLNLLASSNLSDLGNLATALSNLGFLTSASSNGYVKLPGGIYIQWGLGTLSSGSATVTFPTAFPNNCFVATAAYSGNNSGSFNPLYIGLNNRTQMGVGSISSSYNYGFLWIAIGN